MSFINFNNRIAPEAKTYTAEIIAEALYQVETRNKNKIQSIVESIKEPLATAEALSLFENKLEGLSALQSISARSRLANQPNDKVDEATKIDVGYALKDIEEFNRGNSTFDDTIESIVKNLGYKTTPKNIKAATDHIAASQEDEDQIPVDKDLVDELYGVLESNVNEARSIGKIQKEWAKVTGIMKDTVAKWKVAKGQEKDDLLTQLKTLTAAKKKLEAELDTAVGLKDADAELVGESSDKPHIKKSDLKKLKRGDKIKWYKAGGITTDEVLSVDGIYVELKSGGVIPYQSIVKESLNEADFGKPADGDYSDEMTYGQLERCIDYATMLRERYEDGFSFDPWMHSAVNTAKNELNSVFDALDGGDGVVEGLELTEGLMSDLHQMAKEVKDEEEFVKQFFKNYGDKVKENPKSIEWVKSLYKDTVNESSMNDPVLMAFRAAKMKREKELAKPKRKPLYGKQRQKAEDDLWVISQDLKDLYADRGQLLIDMEQEAGAEGGPIADEYGDKLNKIEGEIQKLITKRNKLEMRLAEGFINEDEDTVNESAQPGEWIAYIDYPRGKKLVKVLKSHRAAVRWNNKNVDDILMQDDVEGVGIMSKEEWDKEEAQYAIESNVTEAVTNIKVGDLVAHDESGERYIVVSKPSKTKIVVKNKKGDEKVLSTHHVTLVQNEKLALNEAKRLERDEMMVWLEDYLSTVRTSEEFDGSEDGIWTSGESGDTYKNEIIYDYYSGDTRNREFGVLNKWEKELNKRGWYSEWYDPGTVMIWRNW